MKRQFFLFVCIVCSLAACHEERGEHEVLLDHLDSLLWTDPKQALAEIEPLMDEVDDWSESEQMRYWIEYVDAKNKYYIGLTADDEVRMKDAMNYYERIGDNRMLAWSHYLLGSVWGDMGDGVSALDAWNKTIECAKKAVPVDVHRISLTYLQMARKYICGYLCDEALESLDSAMVYAKMIHEPILEQGILAVKNTVYYYLHKYDSLLVCTDAIRMVSLQEGDTALASTCVIQALVTCVITGDTVNAMRYLDIYESSDWVDENCHIVKGDGTYYLAKGMCLLFEQKYEQARYFFEKEREDFLDWDNQQAAYQGLTAYYEAIGKLDSALVCARRQIVAADSSYIHQNNYQAQSLKQTYDYSRMQHIAKEESERRESVMKWLFMVCGLFVFAIFAEILIVQRQRSKRKAEKSLAKMHLAEKEAEIAHVTIELMQLQQSKDADQAIIAETEAQLKDLTVELGKLQLRVARFEKATSSLWYLDDELVKHLKQKARREKATPEELESFRLLMKEKEARFYLQLTKIVPKLSEKEIMVCLMRKLNFANHEIATLLVLADGSVSTLRTRIYMKATGRESGSTRDFEKWLSSLGR